jgi:antitoxin (DNA-binding transcriptional repressor) of toxin-antitoxin stability system
MTISLEDAQSRLGEVIRDLAPGEEVLITENEKPIARLVAEPIAELPKRRLGTQRGSVLYMAPDFDAPLEDFKEYME